MMILSLRGYGVRAFAWALPSASQFSPASLLLSCGSSWAPLSCLSTGDTFSCQIAARSLAMQTLSRGMLGAPNRPPTGVFHTHKASLLFTSVPIVRSLSTSQLQRAPLPPGGAKKGPRDKGPRRTAELSLEVVTGCSLMKGDKDPVLKPDSEYPEWLWLLADPMPSISELQKKYEGVEGLSMEELQRLYRLKNKKAINEANESTAKK